LIFPPTITAQHAAIISLVTPAPIKLPDAPVLDPPRPVPYILLPLPATIAAAPPRLQFSIPAPIKFQSALLGEVPPCE
jgi:hypothetical protein